MTTNRPRPARAVRPTPGSLARGLALAGAIALAAAWPTAGHADPSRPVGAEVWAIPPIDGSRATGAVPAWPAPAPVEPPTRADGVETVPVRPGTVEATGGVAAETAAPGPAAVRAAPSGDAHRWMELGRFFELSAPPSQDLDRARELYCRAAAAGHPEALQRLGWLYLTGRGTAPHPAMAGTLFRWAAELGDPRAAGLAASNPAPYEVAPPCLANAGIASIASLRARLRVARPEPAASPETPPDGTIASVAAIAATAGMAPRLEALPPERRKIVEAVEREARAALLDPRLVLAVIRAESNFDPLARSPRNALGLMQLIPETAQRFNVRNPFDPIENVRGGVAYLRWLLAYYRGDLRLALAAYNAGEGTVDRHRGVPPFAETIAYLQRIRAFYPMDHHPFDAAALGVAPRLVASPALR